MFDERTFESQVQQLNSVGEYSKLDKTRLLVQRKRRALKEKTKSIKEPSLGVKNRPFKNRVQK